MLRIIFINATLVFLSSCSKPGNELPTNGYISFNVNGTTQNWSEGSEYIMDLHQDSSGTYSLNALNLHINKAIHLSFHATSLTINTPYTYTISTLPAILSMPHSISISDLIIYDPPNLFESYKIGDHATVTITAIHGSKYDGRFTALLTRANDSAKINITNGKFAGIGP